VSIKGQQTLKSLAAETGGRSFFPWRLEDLTEIYDSLAIDVQTRYLLSYTPKNQAHDGKWRAIEVTTTSGDTVVQTRKGYFATAPPPIRPSIEFTVSDADQKYFDVTLDDLAVFEDGVEQKIDSFHEAVAPVSVILALDSSGSMRTAAQTVIDAAKGFVSAIRPKDALGVLMFADKSTLMQDLSLKREPAIEAIGQYKAIGGTALYDALGIPFERLKTVEGRRAVVVVTDGRDENNPGTAPGSVRTLDDVMRLQKESGAIVYAVGVGAKVDSRAPRTTGARVGRAGVLPQRRVRTGRSIPAHRRGATAAVRGQLSIHERKTRRRVAQGGNPRPILQPYCVECRRILRARKVAPSPWAVSDLRRSWPACCGCAAARTRRVSLSGLDSTRRGHDRSERGSRARRRDAAPRFRRSVHRRSAYLHAAGMRVLGVNLRTPRLILFGFFMAFLAAVYGIARRVSSPAAACAAMLMATVWSVPNYFAACRPGTTCFSRRSGRSHFLATSSPQHRRWLFMAGTCAGLSLLMKVSGLFYLGAGLVFLAYVEQTTATSPTANRGRSVVRADDVDSHSGNRTVRDSLLWTSGASGLLPLLAPALLISVFLAWREWTDGAGGFAWRARRFRDARLALCSGLEPADRFVCTGVLAARTDWPISFAACSCYRNVASSKPARHHRPWRRSGWPCPTSCCCWPGRRSSRLTSEWLMAAVVAAIGGFVLVLADHARVYQGIWAVARAMPLGAAVTAHRG
jgi:hypothetical protein